MAGLRYDRRDARRIGLQLLSHSLLFLRLLGRFLLCVLRLPLLFQVVSFALIYRHIYNRLALHLEGVWQPGFPHGWTLWIAFLWTIPFWAALQVVWVLLTFCVRRRLSRNTNSKSWRVDGYVVLDGRSSEEDGLPLPSTPSYSSFPTSPLHALLSRLPSLSTVWVLAQLALYTYLVVVGYHEYTHYEHPTDIRLRPALHAALADPRPNPAGYAPRKEKIFIAAAFHQNQDVIPYWTRSMRDAIIYLGTDNVFVSIVENYSSDSSPDLLRAFAQELDTLGVRNRVLVSDETVKKPEHVEWNPRIEFLAAIRNQALEPLVQSGGYDRVLFSNDIYIEPESILELLATRNGEYDFACGLDFGHFGAYDMWVLRDRIGRLTAGFWPYFFDTASYEAIKREEPVPVFSCWNGIVAFNADPVLPVALRSNKTLSQSPLPNPPPANHPWTPVLAESPALTPPLKFRASAEGECYSSESFLLPYDFRRVMALDRIYANPLVVNGYVWKYYAWHKWVLRERYVKWFIEQVWDGAWMQYARMIVGDAKSVWVWDGVECHPWW
ncbi:cryptococcal mannosyltransferase 1-domain-containing protein [Cubamyces menziesii]|nr:cryptococcal mannosyltransferase 1-domain-containing protein [Cubamyces menziesii]